MNDRHFRLGFYLLLVLFGALLFINLGNPPIYILDEAKNAQCAREMLARKDLVVPTFNDRLRTDKPPLHYFFMMIGYSLFGVHAFAARFFSALAGLATLLLAWRFVGRNGSAAWAFFMSLVLVCSTHFIFEFRLSVPDPYLIFFVCAVLVCGYEWLEGKGVGFLYLAAVSAAMAVLAKGPVGIGLPLVVLLIWAVLKKKWEILFTWHLAPALFLFLLLAAPWFIAVDVATKGAWTKGFFFEHNLERFASAKEGHGGNFLLVPAFLLVGMLPFSVYVYEVFKYRKEVFASGVAQFALLVVLVFLVFFGVSGTKLPNYIMPAYPFAGMIIGKYLEVKHSGSIVPKSYPLIILFFFSLALAIGGYFAIRNDALVSSLAWMFLLLAFVPLILIGQLVTSRRSFRNSLRIVFFSWLALNVLFFDVLYPSVYQQNPVEQSNRLVHDASVVYGYKSINPAYVLKRSGNIPMAEHPDSLANWLKANPGIVITKKQYAQELDSLALCKIFEQPNLFESGTNVIFKYCPAGEQ